MRASNGMGRVKYKGGYNSRKRVKRWKWIKRLLILLLIVGIVIGGGSLLGFVMEKVSQKANNAEVVTIMESSAPQETPTPHMTFKDKDLIGRWQLIDSKKTVMLEIDSKFMTTYSENADDSIIEKSYYLSYIDGTLELMEYFESDDPKTTIAPDGSDELYLTKGTYSINGTELTLIIDGVEMKYERVIESTPAPTMMPEEW